MSNTTALDIEEVMVPDTQERYPSAALYREWLGEWLTTSPDDQGEFLIRKACDWQREQDALICEDYPASEGVHLAGFIRSGAP